MKKSISQSLLQTLVNQINDRLIRRGFFNVLQISFYNKKASIQRVTRSANRGNQSKKFILVDESYRDIFYFLNGIQQGEILQAPYLQPDYIETFKEVKQFINYLVYTEALGMGFHPDTPIKDYIRSSDDQPTFNSIEIDALQSCLDKCFEVARKLNFDIYDIGLSIVQTNTDN